MGPNIIYERAAAMTDSTSDSSYNSNCQGRLTSQEHFPWNGGFTQESRNGSFHQESRNGTYLTEYRNGGHLQESRPNSYPHETRNGNHLQESRTAGSPVCHQHFERQPAEQEQQKFLLNNSIQMAECSPHVRRKLNEMFFRGTDLRYSSEVSVRAASSLEEEGQSLYP